MESSAHDVSRSCLESLPSCSCCSRCNPTRRHPFHWLPQGHCTGSFAGPRFGIGTSLKQRILYGKERDDLPVHSIWRPSVEGTYILRILIKKHMTQNSQLPELIDPPPWNASHGLGACSSCQDFAHRHQLQLSNAYAAGECGARFTRIRWSGSNEQNTWPSMILQLSLLWYMMSVILLKQYSNHKKLLLWFYDNIL